LIVHGGPNRALEVGERATSTLEGKKERGCVAQVVVDDFVGGDQSNGCLMDSVENFVYSEQELRTEGAAAGHLNGSLELGESVFG
jgi:hypothetical protein